MTVTNRGIGVKLPAGGRYAPQEATNAGAHRQNPTGPVDSQVIKGVSISPGGVVEGGSPIDPFCLRSRKSPVAAVEDATYSRCAGRRAG